MLQHYAAQEDATLYCQRPVKGNDELKVAAAKRIEIIVAQLKTLKTKKSDW